MKLNKILDFLEEKFPTCLAEEWDNVGLIIGQRNSEINKIMIALDLTKEVIDEAVMKKCNLIITHHPAIFNPIKKINSDSILGMKILELISQKISVYSMHTNVDSAKLGLNDFLGEEILKFKNGKILDLNEKNCVEYGIGRTYELEKEIDIQELISVIKSRLQLENLSFTNLKINKKIKKVALVNGSGAAYWRKAKKAGTQVLITGDVKYHDAVDAKENNFHIIDIGHFESECIFPVFIEKILKNKFDVEIEIYEETPIFTNC